MSLFGSFFGSDQRGDIANASQQANDYYRRGLDQYTDTTKQYLDQSLGQFAGLQPFINSGSGAIKLLSDALGINGAGAQSGFYQGFQTDPGFQATQDAGIQALDRSAAARGLLRSGGQQRDLFSFGQRQLGDAFNNRINSLFGMGQFGGNLGANVAGQQAGLIGNAGNNIAGAQLGTNQLFANNAINTGNAMASASSAGINNLLGLGNLFAKPLTGWLSGPTGLKK